METSIPVLSLEADTQIQVIDFFPLGDTSSGSNNHSDLLLILSVSEQLTFSLFIDRSLCAKVLLYRLTSLWVCLQERTFKPLNYNIPF